MENTHPAKSLEADISVQIFAASAAMLGVCLTVIGLVRVVITSTKMDTLADDSLALNSLIFLTSAILAYIAMRTRTSGRMYRIERMADYAFFARAGAHGGELRIHHLRHDRTCAVSTRTARCRPRAATGLSAERFMRDDARLIS